MCNGCLYRLTFPNGKAYIGITGRTAATRFAEHVTYSRVGKNKGAVHLAIVKYGAANVIVETLAEESNWTRLQELEVQAVAAHNTRPPHGYNLTRGGDGVVGFDENTRAKMGAANIGRHASNETRAKLSVAGKGRKRSETTRAKMRKPKSDAHRSNMSAAQKGHAVSAEARAKMSVAHSGKVLSTETRAKIGAASTGRIFSQDSLDKRKATRREKTGGYFSTDALERIGAAQRGKIVSAETRAKIGAANRISKASKINPASQESSDDNEGVTE